METGWVRACVQRTHTNTQTHAQDVRMHRTRSPNPPEKPVYLFACVCVCSFVLRGKEESFISARWADGGGGKGRQHKCCALFSPRRVFLSPMLSEHARGSQHRSEHRGLFHTSVCMETRFVFAGTQQVSGGRVRVTHATSTRVSRTNVYYDSRMSVSQLQKNRPREEREPGFAVRAHLIITRLKTAAEQQQQRSVPGIEQQLSSTLLVRFVR